ncbi:conjugal transfer protein TraB [Halobacteriales archaeon SW_7_68_16]|nr:MAG: conjugal transfer protein TraB [Halobacteriales archaeon SW_7_68_16]
MSEPAEPSDDRRDSGPRRPIAAVPGSGRAADATPADDEGRVRVVGTAHVSAESAERVRETVAEDPPDVVAVELDEGRYGRLCGETPDDLEPGDLLDGGTVFQFLAYWMLSYVQTRLGNRFDIEPGADMRAAIESADAAGAEIALVDRDIQVTIQRFWAKMSLWEKLKMLGSLFVSLLGFGGSVDDEFDIEELTDGDAVTAIMEEFREFSPGGADALIDERDAYIAHGLVSLRRRGYDVVAVVGAGHRAGIERYLEQPGTLPPFESLVGTHDRRFSIARALGYLFTVGFLVAFLLLVLGGAGNGFLLKVAAAWFLFNGVFAFALAKVAGARWTSAGVGGAVAWLTSLNPLLAPGWFAGYLELRHEPVSVGDISRLNDLLADESLLVREVVGQMRQVPLFKLVLVVAATNVGSIVASFLFPFVVLPWLAPEVGGVGGVLDLMVQGMENGLAVLRGLV